MVSTISEWLGRVQARGMRRPSEVTLQAWERERTFLAFDAGDDTFVIEKGILERLEHKDPILIVRKDALSEGRQGMVFTISSGNHGVVIVPLLCGRFWDLGAVPKERRDVVLTRELLCGSVAKDSLELSQRDTPTSLVVEVDAWLQQQDWPIDRIVMADRVDATLEHYRQLGQEWRVRPLAWTRDEMVGAIRASRKRIHTETRYYHNVKGVHLLAPVEFSELADMAESDFEAFRLGLTELVGLSTDSACSMMRSTKYHGHHEIELFGLPAGVAEARLLPPIEQLLCGIQDGRITPETAARTMRRVERNYRVALLDPALAEDDSDLFVATMYKHLTGEIYLGVPGEIRPAFDDRKTAVPGATYVEGVARVHPGADARALAILDYVQSTLSHGEHIEYVNVYEIRGERGAPLGEGQTREVVFKTDRRPLPHRLIEKRLAHKSTGYGNYTLARVQGFRALGISYGPHHMLARHDGRSGEVHFYVRERYPGEPFNAIPPSRFLTPVVKGRSSEQVQDAEVFLVLAALLGESSAENMVLKKFINRELGNRFGVGKEVVEFGYDVHRGRELPLRVRLCSVRGTLGWPDTTRSDENLEALFEYYMRRFAEVLVDFHAQHATVVSFDDAVDAFFEGFASKTREIYWNYASRREAFDRFEPRVKSQYAFPHQWRFALWALTEQRNRLDTLQECLMQSVSELRGAVSETDR